MERRIQSIYMKEKPVRIGEKNEGEVITDEIYIPMSDLIKDFIDAGGRLQRAREEYYHDKYGKDEMEDFVPLKMGADPVEASQYMEAVSVHIAEKQKRIDEERDAARAKIEEERRASAENVQRNVSTESRQDLPSGAGQGVDK